jgi:hypothetical protein
MIQGSLPFGGSWPWLPHCFSTPPAWALPHIDFRQPVTSPATSRLVKVFDYTLRSQSLFNPWGTLPNSKGTRYCCHCGMIPTWRLYFLSPLLGVKSMNKICSSSSNSIPKFTINWYQSLILTSSRRVLIFVTYQKVVGCRNGDRFARKQEESSSAWNCLARRRCFRQ